MAMAGDVEVMVPLEGLVDTEAELDKLEKDRQAREGLALLRSEARRSELHVARAARGARQGPAELAEAEAGLAKMQVALGRLK